MKENCECTYELSRDRLARKGITETLPSIACPPAQPGGNTEDNSADLEKLKADLAEAQKAKEAAEAAKTEAETAKEAAETAKTSAEAAKEAAEEKATESAKAAEAAKEAEAQAQAEKEAAEQAKAAAEQAKAEAEQAKEAAETEAETARALAANANVAKDQAERDKEAAQASEAAAIAKAEKAKEDLNVTIAELVTKQNELTAKDTEIAELKRKLEECQQDKCPEVDVVSLGDETVFSGNSCDTVAGLDAPTETHPNDHL